MNQLLNDNDAQLIPTVAKSFYQERLNKASLANTTKRNYSKYKEVYISAEVEPIFKESYFIVKLDSIQEVKKRNSS